MCPFMNSKLRLVLKTSTIALAVLSAATCPVLAQQAPNQQKQSQSLELESVQQDIENTKRRQQELLAEIKALDRDVGAINRALIESAKRGQALETHISKVEVNLKKLTDTQRGLRNSLSQKRGLLSDVLGTLQTDGEKPTTSPAGSTRRCFWLRFAAPCSWGPLSRRSNPETNALFAELTALREISQSVEQEKA